MKPIRTLHVSTSRSDLANTEPLYMAAEADERFEPSWRGQYWWNNPRACIADGMRSGFDCAILLGDRVELLEVAAQCLRAGVPIVHYGAGEVTLGAIDDDVRDAIALLSSAWLTYSDVAWAQMDEDGFDLDRVRTCGLPALDGMTLPTQRAPKKHVLVAVNPVTRCPGEVGQIFTVLEATLVNGNLDLPILISTPNEDAQFQPEVSHYVQDWLEEGWAQPVKGFRAALKEAAFIIGNSSAGILEAPMFGVPTIDLGTRQQGRPKLPSVQSMPPNEMRVCNAIGWAMRHDREFTTPYFNPEGACKAALNAIAEWRELS